MKWPRSCENTNRICGQPRLEFQIHINLTGHWSSPSISFLKSSLLLCCWLQNFVPCRMEIGYGEVRNGQCVTGRAVLGTAPAGQALAGHSPTGSSQHRLTCVTSLTRAGTQLPRKLTLLLLPQLKPRKKKLKVRTISNGGPASS